MTQNAGGVSQAGGRLSSLDLLRFCAACAVVLYHYVYRADDPALGIFESTARHGYLGVDFFFLISGFVVLWSARGRTATQFARARALRLYPEFWLSVLISALALWSFPRSSEPLTSRDVLLNLTMIPQYLGAPYVDGVYWTLGVELKFYVLLWLTILIGGLRRIEGILMGWALLASLGSLIDLGGVFDSLLIHPFGTLFASGGLFFLVFDSGWTWQRAATLILALAASVFLALGRMDDFVDPSHITRVARLTTAILVVAFYAAFALVASKRWLLMHSELVALLGALTYPLYLLHNVGRWAFLSDSSPFPRWLGGVVGVAVSLGLAYAVMRAARRWILPLLRAAIDRLTEAATASSRGVFG